MNVIPLCFNDTLCYSLTQHKLYTFHLKSYVHTTYLGLRPTSGAPYGKILTWGRYLSSMQEVQGTSFISFQMQSCTKYHIIIKHV
jgi:hypothetical protein